MTHKEAIKNLTELQIRLINDNSEEAIEYNKKIYDTLAYFITQTIPLSVIEKIKKGIYKEITSGGKWSGGWYEVTEEHAIKTFNGIIDKAVKECTHDKG